MEKDKSYALKVCDNRLCKKEVRLTWFFKGSYYCWTCYSKKVKKIKQ